MSFDKEAFEEQVINDMREHGGVISSGPMAGTRLLVLTTIGAKTGKDDVRSSSFRTTVSTTSSPERPVARPETQPGSTTSKANPTASIEVDGRQFEAAAAIAEGAERDRLWQQHLAVQPQLAAHAEQAGRVIPMVRLTPLNGEERHDDD